MNTTKLRETIKKISSSREVSEEEINQLYNASRIIDQLRKELEESECTCEKLRKEHQEAHQKEIDDYKKGFKSKISEETYKHFTGDA
jgi:ribosomal protein L14E/L6E/L27E